MPLSDREQLEHLAAYLRLELNHQKRLGFHNVVVSTRWARRVLKFLEERARCSG